MYSLLSLICCFTFSYASLQIRDCNNSPNKIIHFENAHLSADPVHIPGPETGDVDVQILQPVSGNHYTLSAHIAKKILFGYVEVPCISGVGSCDYELCDLLSGKNWNNTHHCPPEIDASSPDFPCSCPFQPGTYHLNPTTFIIPELAGLWKFLASGDYKAHATVTDRNTGEVVGCYDLQIKTEADCSGFGCLIGR
ncbi:hypothetical protein ACF0H5_007938 [Mactra antiquata]